MTTEVTLHHGIVLRSLQLEHAASLATAYRRNRDHLAPWDPRRTDAFFTRDEQAHEIERMLVDERTGDAKAFVLTDASRIVGRVNLSSIVRGTFLNANLGYWIDGGLAGRGLMTAAVDAVIGIARDELQLHRIQAATLLHNDASQTVLQRCGFVEIGMAPEYLRIAGWCQDHRLFQRIISS